MRTKRIVRAAYHADGRNVRDMLGFMKLAELKAKKREAQERLEQVPGVEGFGVGDGTVRVYLRSPGVKDGLPTEIGGVPLEFIVTGDVIGE